MPTLCQQGRGLDGLHKDAICLRQHGISVRTVGPGLPTSPCGGSSEKTGHGNWGSHTDKWPLTGGACRQPSHAAQLISDRPPQSLHHLHANT